MQMPLRVLITDGEQRSVVAAVRGLAAAGYSVTATASSRPAAAQWSRDCARRLDAPSVTSDGGAALAQILRGELERERYAAVIPGSDGALRALSRHRGLLEPLARLGLPAEAAIERSLDKLLLLEQAAWFGLDAPASHVCATASELRACAEEVGYPVMLKPARSVDTDGTWRTQMSVIVREPAQLAAAGSTLAEPFTLQRFHEAAPVVSVAGVIDDGVLLGTAVARYARTWPPQAGSASASITIAPPEGLVERSRQLLTEIGWRGIFELEFLELADGRHAAIDLNPRVYGSMSLAIAAGANLPAIWVDVLRGRSPRPVVARPGVHYRWEEGEVRALVRAALRGHGRELLGVMRPRRPAVWALSRPTDPGPLLARGLAAGRVRGLALKRTSRVADA
jgi:predicted ATP-grasp superfamily ATP-dependent carboligase